MDLDWIVYSIYFVIGFYYNLYCQILVITCEINFKSWFDVIFGINEGDKPYKLNYYFDNFNMFYFYFIFEPNRIFKNAFFIELKKLRWRLFIKNFSFPFFYHSFVALTIFKYIFDFWNNFLILPHQKTKKYWWDSRTHELS